MAVKQPKSKKGNKGSSSASTSSSSTTSTPATNGVHVRHVEGPAATLPLFPLLDASQVRGLRVHAILEGNETEPFEGYLPADTTVQELYDQCGDEETRTLHVEVVAVTEDDAGNEKDVDACDVQRGPFEKPPTGEGRGVLMELPPKASTRKRTGSAHLVVPDNAHTVVPAGSDVRTTRSVMRESEMTRLSRESHKVANDAIATGAKMVFAAAAEGIRGVFEASRDRDATVRGLELENARLRREHEEDRATMARARTQLEMDHLRQFREYAQEIGKRDKKLMELDAEREEAEAEARQAKGWLRRIGEQLFDAHGGDLMTQLANKFGLKLGPGGEGGGTKGGTGGT